MLIIKVRPKSSLEFEQREKCTRIPAGTLFGVDKTKRAKLHFTDSLELGRARFA